MRFFGGFWGVGLLTASCVMLWRIYINGEIVGVRDLIRTLDFKLLIVKAWIHV